MPKKLLGLYKLRAASKNRCLTELKISHEINNEINNETHNMLNLIDTMMSAADYWVDHWPRRMPQNIDTNCRIISHRGERDNLTVYENTFAAFDPLVEFNATAPNIKVWGIECDIRWSKDLEPMIVHDADLKRLHNDNRPISSFTYKALRKTYPHIPHLAELSERYGDILHFMLEVKSEPYPKQSLQNERLLTALQGLEAQTHFHLYSFDTELLEKIDVVPASAKIAIAVFNRKEALQHVLEHDYAGLGAHYTVMNKNSIRKLKTADKRVCVGMVDTRRSLYRALSREGEWLFSNQAIAMAQELEKL